MTQNFFPSFSVPPPPIRAESDIPGYSYDPATGKYYAILPNAPGQPAGSTRNDLKHIRENYDRQQLLERLEQEHDTDEDTSRPRSQRIALPFLLEQVSLGATCGRSLQPLVAAKRRVEERRLRTVHQKASYSFDVMDSNNSLVGFNGCQFLDVREEGKTLIGCWSTGEFGSDSSQSRVITYSLSVNSKEAQKYLRRREQLLQKEENSSSTNNYSNGYRLPSSTGNAYGLRFVPVGNCLHIPGTFIDMTLAQADADVTCLLYATAFSLPPFDSEGVRTSFSVHLRPVEQLTREEGRESMTSPIYNVDHYTTSPVWSCAFNSNHMRIGIGMEKNAMIYDILTGLKFRVSSGGMNVIANQFSKEGNLLYLGRLSDDIWMLDLRMRQNHRVGQFPSSASTSFIYQMKHRPDYILTDNFNGKVQLFDTRTCRRVLKFEGHKNSSHKVPCYVDEDERFFFAVGEDGVARAWSLATGGQPLAQLVCPKSSGSYTNSDFSRLVYSPRLGGASGNAALILATDGDIHVHELLV